MIPIELTLPEFCFLHGSEHDDDTLKMRTIIAHTSTATVMEVFSSDEAAILNDDVAKYEFEYINIYGVVELLTIAVHRSFAPKDMLQEILDKVAGWYRDYCNWEDRNIHNEDHGI